MHKRKGKNKPKNPNPIPQNQSQPPKVIENVIVQETSSEIKEKKCENITQIPIITSEVKSVEKEEIPSNEADTAISPTLQENVKTQAAESNQPQKPKRNRGNKNKNQGSTQELLKETIENVAQEDLKITAVPEKADNITLTDKTDDCKVPTDDKGEDGTPMSPSKRKKKNKGKKTEPTSEHIAIQPEVVDDKTESTAVIQNVEVDPRQCLESEFIEIPSAKKKNKKNKITEHSCQTEVKISAEENVETAKKESVEVPLKFESIKETLERKITKENEFIVENLEDQTGECKNYKKLDKKPKKGKKEIPQVKDLNILDKEKKSEEKSKADQLSKNVGQDIDLEILSDLPSTSSLIPKDQIDLTEDLKCEIDKENVKSFEISTPITDDSFEFDMTPITDDIEEEVMLTNISAEKTEKLLDLVVPKTPQQDLLIQAIEYQAKIEPKSIENIKVKSNILPQIEHAEKLKDIQTMSKFISEQEALKSMAQVIDVKEIDHPKTEEQGSRTPPVKPSKRCKKAKNKNEDGENITEITNIVTKNLEEEVNKLATTLEIKTELPIPEKNIEQLKTEVIQPELVEKPLKPVEQITFAAKSDYKMDQQYLEKTQSVERLSDKVEKMIKTNEKPCFKQEVIVDMQKAEIEDKNKEVITLEQPKIEAFLCDKKNLSVKDSKVIRRSRSREREERSSPICMTKHNIENLFPHFQDTKIDHKPEIIQEDTDLKTKVVQVNKNMEDLKLSIERTLAELTKADDIQNNPFKTQQPFHEVDPTPEMVKSLDIKHDIAITIERSPEKTTPSIEISAKALTPQPTDIKEPKGKGKGKGKKGKKFDSDLPPQEHEKSTVTELIVDVSKATSPEKEIMQKVEPGEPQKLQESSDLIKSKDTLKVVEHFEDALSSSIEDIDAKFDLITQDTKMDNSAKTDSDQSKNWVGPKDSPVTSNKTDYKKEKDKIIQPPKRKEKNKKQNIEAKDAQKFDTTKQTIDTKVNSIDAGSEKTKDTEASVTTVKFESTASENLISDVKIEEAKSDDEEYVYKYSFRKVFIANSCHICKTLLKNKRFECNYCHLVFYCSQKHKDEDWSTHQGFCFAVSTVAHLKGLKYIYADVKNLTAQDWRLKRMQVIVACEKVLKRKLQPFEQEMLLYPRLCLDPGCKEWKTSTLTDCEGCGQVSCCSADQSHLPESHKEWCKSYSLYYQLVEHQQIKGRIEPKLPKKIVKEFGYTMPSSLAEIFEFLYEGKVDMDEIHYASLTQIATAPLTAAFSYQLYNKKLYNTTNINNSGSNISSFTLHIVGAEMQFEADVQNKWELFFLHLYPEIRELKVVFIGPELNPGNLPLDLLAKIRLCKGCKTDKRKLIFEYEDKQLYHDFVKTKRFTKPDLVCAFNPGLHRSTGYNAADTWPETIISILKLNVPFCVTSYTKHELPKDLARVKECFIQVKIHFEPTLNPYASLRPDRNFISDEEMPLIFKNYWFMVISG